MTDTGYRTPVEASQAQAACATTRHLSHGVRQAFPVSALPPGWAGLGVIRLAVRHRVFDLDLPKEGAEGP